jgi:hypothetical protein
MRGEDTDRPRTDRGTNLRITTIPPTMFETTKNSFVSSGRLHRQDRRESRA